MYGFKNSIIIDLQEDQVLNGLQSSYAYEVIRLIKARPLFFDLHYQRLVKTCQTMGFYPPEKDKLLEEVFLITEKKKVSEINIKIIVDQHNYLVFPIESRYPSSEMYTKGVECSFLFAERKNPEIKVFRPQLSQKSNQQISQQDIFESILVNDQGFITEGSRSNLFFIKENTIYTAPDELVLGGITRLKVMEIIEQFGLNLKLMALNYQQLSTYQAAFICGTSPGVLPIKRIDKYHFDVQNPLLRQIHDAYHSRYLSKHVF